MCVCVSLSLLLMSQSSCASPLHKGKRVTQTSVILVVKWFFLTKIQTPAPKQKRFDANLNSFALSKLSEEKAIFLLEKDFGHEFASTFVSLMTSIQNKLFCTHTDVWCKEFGKCATTVRDTPNDARVFITNTQHQRLLARNWIRCFIDTHRESIRISLWDWNSTSFKNLHLMKSARGDRKFLEKPPKAFAQGQGFSWSGKKQARNSAGAAIPCYRNNRPSSFRTWPYYQFDLWVQLREHPLRSSYR